VAPGAPPQGRRSLTVRLTSSDGVSLAVHDLGGEGTPLLFSHATGFHGHCYAPLARRLHDAFHSWAVDYRGHAASSQPAGLSGEALDWRGCGDDAVLTATTVAPDGGIIGFGHSMGGSALLMAAHRRPDLFSRLVIFEPIVFPPFAPTRDPEEMPIVIGARRRRRRFESLQAAFDNFSSKPPLSMFDHDVLHAYVEHGFAPARDGEGVELCCTPEFEAATFGGSMHNGVWELLAEIATPVAVVAGALAEDQPSRTAPATADALPNGRFVSLPHMTHFGPFTHVAEIADLIRHA
jgi:pimeloyl-ACP methyl ester carboxylesterase